MMSWFWLIATWLGGDPCSPSLGLPEVEVDPHSMEIHVSRAYGIPWAICAQEKGAPPPLLRISAKDDSGTHLLLEKPMDLRVSLHDGMRSLSASASGCSQTAPNRRAPGALLQGPVGNRHWYNRRTIEVELIAEGAFAPLAFKEQKEVYCRACDDGNTVSFSYYVNDFDKNTARMVVSVDKERFACAKGGGRMLLRRFWGEPDAETWSPLRPYEVIDNLQDRLKPDGDRMNYEAVEPYSHFCKPGKSNLFELVGIDEYATIIRRNYGPSDAIHRSSIEFLRCN
ncbi:MAG: hypothetical protein RL385_444 [Pseudomonadota bacterium]|jgi:hypothetical protein